MQRISAKQFVSFPINFIHNVKPQNLLRFIYFSLIWETSILTQENTKMFFSNQQNYLAKKNVLVP